MRATEYARLDRVGHLYPDYAGGGLYAESQVRAHMALLRDHVFGNLRFMQCAETFVDREAEAEGS